MSTLRINNIEAQSIPASPTIDEKVKVTNSSGDILVNIDGKTSGITTIGINTTDGNIKFDANSNVLITGILTATTLAGNFTPDSLEIGSNIKLGNAGVITATSFVGSGANLTGITGTTINNNGSNRIITGSSTANTLEGEATFTYDGTSVAKIDTSQTYATFRLDGNAGGAIEFYENGTRRFEIYGTDPEVALYDRDKGAYHTRFKSGGNVEISDGKLLIGTTTEGNIAADNLTVADSADSGITIRSGTSNSGNLFFSDGTSGGDEYRGYLQYQHSNNKLSIGTNASTRLALDGDGRVLIGLSSDSRTTSLIISGNSSTGATGQAVLNMDIGTTSISDGTSIGVFRFGATGDRRGADIRAEGAGTWSAGSSHPTDLIFGTNRANTSSTPTERMRIRSDGHVQLQHGLTGLSGGGVIVCAAKSSTGTANQSNYKVDFVVPMGDLGTKQEYEDIRAQFGSGQTGTDWSHALGGSGILIATVQNNYYWGFRTKIYHITTYGNSSNNVTQLNLLHNYSAAGHGGNSAAVDLAVQSHDGKTPKLRATFSGDYWNSNVLTVTYIGSAVASTGNIRQLTTFDSKLTGQDPTWK